MSRSNGPIGQVRGAAPQQWQQPADQDPLVAQAYAAAQAAVQPAQPRFPQQQGFGNVQGHAQPQYAPPAQPQQTYQAQRPQPAADQGYYAAPQYAPAQPQQPSYQPVFDRYSPPVDPRQAAFEAQRQQAARPAPQPQSQQAQPSLYDTHAQLRGGTYDQWPQPAATHPQPTAPAARGYDFASYMPASTPGQDYGRQPLPPQHQAPAQRHSAQPQYADPQQAGPQWQLGGTADRHDEFADQSAEYAQHQPRYDQHGYDGEPGNQLQHAGDPAYDADDVPDYEEDEPRRSRRGLVMVSALVGAIALGGGLAYAYKTFIKPKAAVGTQVAKVAAPKEPAKIQPAEPGGKQFPNQESKLQNRLGDGSAPDGDGGVKRVQTVVIGRDGAVSAPAATGAVPGMVVVQPQAAPAAAAQQIPIATAPPAPPPQAAAPVRVAAIAPQPRAPVPVVNAVVPEPIAAAPPAIKKPAVKKAPAARDDLVAAAGGAPAAAAVTPAKPSTSSGFVAVVASKGSKADAERTNADLEQRYDVLKGKIFDVQEANLTAQGKGVVYRSVVGPPGSREFASGVCSQLKAAGYNDCWPVKY